MQNTVSEDGNNVLAALVVAWPISLWNKLCHDYLLTDTIFCTTVARNNSESLEIQYVIHTNPDIDAHFCSSYMYNMTPPTTTHHEWKKWLHIIGDDPFAY